MNGSSAMMRAMQAIALLLAFGAGVTRSHATALDVAIDGDVVSVMRGAHRTVTATITNLDTTVVFLNGISSGVTPDDADAGLFDAFEATKPDSLGPGESWEGPVLDLALSATAPLGPRVFDLTLSGGAHPYANDVIGVGYFAIDDSTAFVGVPAGRAAGPLLRASPNPFRGELGIDFVAPVAGRYEVAVYDVSGRRVAQLLDADLAAGPHHVTWNRQVGSGATAAGVFFVRVAHADHALKTKVLRLE